MKRVKGVEDLNIYTIGTQGIVGVGAIIPICIAWFPVEAFPLTARGGFPADRSSSCPFLC